MSVQWLVAARGRLVVAQKNTWPFPTLVGCNTKKHVALPYVCWLLHQRARGPSLPTQRLDISEVRASDDDDCTYIDGEHR